MIPLFVLFWQALIDLKQFEKADDNFIRAIELEPDNGNIYVHRGFVLLIKNYVTLYVGNFTSDLSTVYAVTNGYLWPSPVRAPGL